MISIIDYGVGNLRSVQKAFEVLGISAEITSESKIIETSKAIVLPGVGAFPDAMKELKYKGLDEAIKKAVKSGKPMLGICLGMQLLFEVGYEVEECEGLGFIKGSIRKLESNVKIPHMGWNNLDIIKECKLLKDVTPGSYAYFVHSFYAEVSEETSLKAVTFYGKNIPAIVSKGNIYGAQFHPEKSGKIGMQILKNFGELSI